MRSISPAAFDLASQPPAGAAPDAVPDPPGTPFETGQTIVGSSPLWRIHLEPVADVALAPDHARVEGRLRQATILECARLVLYMLAPYAAALWLLESFRESPEVNVGYPPHWLSFPEGFFDAILGEGGETRVGNFVLALHQSAILAGQALFLTGGLATMAAPLLARDSRALAPWLSRAQTFAFLMAALGATLLAIETVAGSTPIVPAVGSAFLTAVIVATARLDGATMRWATLALLGPVATAFAVWVYFRHPSPAYYVLAALPVAWLVACWWLAGRRDRAIRELFRNELVVEGAARDRDRALEASRKARDDALLEREKAERANRAKGKLLDDICHDLRQPLGALKWYAELIKDEADGPALQTAGKIVAAANSMDEMLGAMLELARIESGKARPVFADFPLDSWLASLDHQVRPLALQRGLAFSVVPCRGVAHSDEGRLMQIVRNFLVNAVRYTPPEQDGRRGRVVLGCRRSGGALRIEVWDNGIGIPQELQEEIFRPSTRSTIRRATSARASVSACRLRRRGRTAWSTGPTSGRTPGAAHASPSPCPCARAVPRRKPSIRSVPMTPTSCRSTLPARSSWSWTTSRARSTRSRRPRAAGPTSSTSRATRTRRCASCSTVGVPDHPHLRLPPRRLDERP